MNVLTRPWTHVFDYKGRSTRREFWLFVVIFYAGIFLMGVLANLVAGLFGFAAIHSEDLFSGLFGLVVLAYVGFSFAVFLAVAVRRLHDHDKSGWLFLLSFVPLVGWIFFLIMMLTPGNDYENSYGRDPRLGDEPEDVSHIFA